MAHVSRVVGRRRAYVRRGDRRRAAVARPPARGMGGGQGPTSRPRSTNLALGQPRTVGDRVRRGVLTARAREPAERQIMYRRRANDARGEEPPGRRRRDRSSAKEKRY